MFSEIVRCSAGVLYVCETGVALNQVFGIAYPSDAYRIDVFMYAFLRQINEQDGDDLLSLRACTVISGDLL